MSVHNVQTKLETPLGFTSTGSLLWAQGVGRAFGFGATAGNGLENWMSGAIFANTTNGTLERNIGTSTTAEWSELGSTAVQELVDAGGYFGTDTIDDALQIVGADRVSTSHSAPIPLGGFRILTGAELPKGVADTTTGFLELNSKEQVLTMAGGQAATVIATSVALPTNLDSTADVTLHYLVGKGANDDATTSIEVEIMPTKANEVNQADIVTAGGTQTVTALYASALTENTVTIAAAGVDDPTTTVVVWHINVTVANNATDDVYIAGCWLEYTGKFLT